MAPALLARILGQGSMKVMKQSGATRYRASVSVASPFAAFALRTGVRGLVVEARARCGEHEVVHAASRAIGPFTSAGRSE